MKKCKQKDIFDGAYSRQKVSAGCAPAAEQGEEEDPSANKHMNCVYSKLFCFFNDYKYLKTVKKKSEARGMQIEMKRFCGKSKPSGERRTQSWTNAHDNRFKNFVEK